MVEQTIRINICRMEFSRENSGEISSFQLKNKRKALLHQKVQVLRAVFSTHAGAFHMFRRS